MRPVFVIVALLVSGCFSYRRLEPSNPPREGWQIAARLSVPLEVRLQETTVHDIDHLWGRVVFADADSVVVAVSRYETSSGSGYPGLGSLSVIPSAHVAHLDQRHVSPVRTGLAVGVGALGMASILAAVGPMKGFLGIGGTDKEQP